MKDARAMFDATVHGLRTVPSRKVIQIILEAPIEQQAEIARICEHGAWVAVARLDPEATKHPAGATASGTPAPDKSLPKGSAMARAHIPWKDRPPAQQAGALCADPMFHRFLENRYPQFKINDNSDAAGAIRELCNVPSRANLNDNHKARLMFQLVASDYFAWKAAPAVVPA